MKIIEHFPHYLQLMRVDKPIGWLLLLWPTLCALWVASDGAPSAKFLWIFVLGVFVMRAAGCVINDFADRDIDPEVDRTQSRPLASGAVSGGEAIVLFCVLGVFALALLFQLPQVVWLWAIPAVILTVIYPYMKRFIQAPQLVLGLAFSFGIPMVYVASQHAFDKVFWILMISNIIWVLIYDTQYAMSDREDDLKVGVNSTAILFGKYDRLIIGLLQLAIMVLLFELQKQLMLGAGFLISIALVAVLFVYQQHLISERDRQKCFQAFLNNAWVGAVIWFGLLAGLR